MPFATRCGTNRDFRFDNDALIIVAHRRFRLLSCPECGTEVRGRFEQKTRRWRHLAIWGKSTFIEAPIRRLRCPQCRKVQTEAVPWARHRSTSTRTFEDVVGLLGQKHANGRAGGGSAGPPERFNGRGEQSISKRLGQLPAVKHHAELEPISQSIAQPA